MKKAQAEAVDRIHEIDFTKGILVIFMVLYHSLNYLYYGSVRLIYLSFVPPSFIMITGFIITQIYLPKYRLDTRSVSKRLGVRSIKIFLIFTLLNLGARMIFSKTHYGISLDLYSFFDEWSAIYFGSQRIVSFQVLLPIAYLLFISIFILRLHKITSYFIHSFAIITFLSCILLEYYGFLIYNLTLTSFGIIGMAIGLLPISSINGFAESRIKLALLPVLYMSFLFIFGDRYFVQVFFTVASLVIIYAVGRQLTLTDWLSQQCIKVGQNSLFSYVIQLMYLHLLYLGCRYLNIGEPNLIIAIITVALTMWISVIIADYVRQKYGYVNLLYKMVFA